MNEELIELKKEQQESREEFIVAKIEKNSGDMTKEKIMLGTYTFVAGLSALRIVLNLILENDIKWLAVGVLFAAGCGIAMEIFKLADLENVRENLEQYLENIKPKEVISEEETTNEEEKGRSM
jgi:hypothetical protein